MSRVWVLVFFCVLSLGCVRAGRDQCNNTDAFRSYVEFSTFSSFLGLCGTSRPCPLCAAAADEVNRSVTNQAVITNWGPFLDSNDCWGQRLRRTPASDPFETVPSKQDFVRKIIAASCNASAVPCSFAYRVDFCPSCPVCPPWVNNCTVTPAQLQDQKDSADKKFNLTVALSCVLGGIVILVVAAAGYACGRHSRK